MWRELIGPLARERRVIAPDLRGFGWTDAPPGGYDPEVFARDLGALLDALEVEVPVDLIGHDWGGWTGFMLCLRHPERVRRFLALSIYHPFIGPNLGGLIGLWRFWYQWVLATPGIGPRAGRFDPVLRWVGADQAGWDARERAIYTDQFLEPERGRAGSLLYRHAVLELRAEDAPRRVPPDEDGDADVAAVRDGGPSPAAPDAAGLRAQRPEHVPRARPGRGPLHRRRAARAGAGPRRRAVLARSRAQAPSSSRNASRSRA